VLLESVLVCGSKRVVRENWMLLPLEYYLCSWKSRVFEVGLLSSAGKFL
jgi:hypothetical protein